MRVNSVGPDQTVPEVGLFHQRSAVFFVFVFFLFIEYWISSALNISISADWIITRAFNPKMDYLEPFI